MDKTQLQTLYKREYIKLCDKYNVVDGGYYRYPMMGDVITMSEATCVVCFILLYIFAIETVFNWIFTVSIYKFIESSVFNRPLVIFVATIYLVVMCVLCKIHMLKLAYPDIVDRLDIFETKSKSRTVLLFLMTNTVIKIIGSTLLFMLFMSGYMYCLYGMYVVFPNQYKHVISDIDNLTYNERSLAISIINEKDKEKFDKLKNEKIDKIKNAFVDQ